MVTRKKPIRLIWILSLVVLFKVQAVLCENEGKGSSWETRAKTGGSGNKEDTMSRIIPLMVMPFMVQTSLLPMMLVSLKFMLIQSMFLGKMAIILGFVTFLRNMLKRENTLYSHNINLHHRQFRSDSTNDFDNILDVMVNSI